MPPLSPASSSSHLRRAQYLSPVGLLTLLASDHGLCAVLWENDRPERVRWAKVTAGLPPLCPTPALIQTVRELDEYFRGRRVEFSIPLDLRGTPFQKRVWKGLLQIPFARTLSYAQLAQKIQKPKAARAVGAAVGKNPLSIIVPCHRVLGSDGSLTGFAGGLKVKTQLLKLEGF